MHKIHLLISKDTKKKYLCYIETSQKADGGRCVMVAWGTVAQVARISPDVRGIMPTNSILAGRPFLIMRLSEAKRICFPSRLFLKGLFGSRRPPFLNYALERSETYLFSLKAFLKRLVRFPPAALFFKCVLSQAKN